MTCPDPLPRTHARLLRYKTHKQRATDYINSNMDWGDKHLKPLRDAIRLSLRASQNQRCYYCRRLIPVERRNVGEAIEHFLDKSKAHYRKWAFHPLNLVIACQPCNIVKSIKDLGDTDVRGAKNLLPTAGEFRWPHPYFDSYTMNIRRAPGPVYSAILGAPKQQEAFNMINDLKLDSLPGLDDRVHESARELQKLQDRLFRMVMPPGRGFVSVRRSMLAIEIKARLQKAMFEIFGI